MSYMEDKLKQIECEIAKYTVFAKAHAVFVDAIIQLGDLTRTINMMEPDVARITKNQFANKISQQIKKREQRQLFIRGRIAIRDALSRITENTQTENDIQLIAMTLSEYMERETLL